MVLWKMKTVLRRESHIEKRLLLSFSSEERNS
jgi:hypothetical protein